MSYNDNFSPKLSIEDSIDSGWLNTIAYYLSAVFSPPLMVVYAVLLCSYAVDIPSAFFWTVLFFGLFLILPTIYTLILMKKGIVSTFHMESREERIKPLSIIATHTLLSIMFFRYLGGPDIFLLIALASLVGIAIVLFISLYWKISGHCAAAGGLLVIVYNFYDTLIYFVASLVLLIAWSRIRLKCHSFPQTTVGFVIGALVFSFIFIIGG